MPTKKQKDILDKAASFAAIAEALREYAICVCFVHWLIENGVLLNNTSPEELAYQFAIRFAHKKDALDAILKTNSIQ